MFNIGVVGFDIADKPPVQLYVVAPLAFKAAACPLQMLGIFTSTDGFDFTVTVDTAVPVHPFVVPVTVYVVVVFNIGVVGFDIADKPPVQLYVVAPLAFNAAVWPSQILGLFTSTDGFDFTVTVDTAVPVHPLVVPVTV